MLETISSSIIHLIQTSGYLGIFILMLLESALIPIPSEVTMPFSGFLAASGNLSLVPVILVGALGNLVGSLIGYYIGYFLNESILLTLIRKYGKFILVTQDDYKTANRWFVRYGNGVVFFSRLLPALRTFISLPAGMFKMNVVKFSIYTLVGSILWSGVLAWIGFYLGGKWSTIGVYFRKFDVVIIAALVILVLLYVNHKLKIVKLRRKK
ncbi:MAG TPA: DedA family protein [Candidatus Saccharimonadales bacterium]|nr:DedA family protein [Candidatus Saccharimonadales bacterium]